MSGRVGISRLNRGERVARAKRAAAARWGRSPVEKARLQCTGLLMLLREMGERPGVEYHVRNLERLRTKMV